MGIADLARLGMLAARLSRPPSLNPPSRIVEERERQSTAGVLYDRYDPRGVARATVVAVHGVTLCGKDHPDMHHFARCLAATGVSCVAPTLPGLSSMQFDPTDIELLAGLIQEIADEREGKVLLMGFCYGASYSLLAATRPEAKDKVRNLLSIGAYNRLEAVIESYQNGQEPSPDDGDALDDWMYRNFILAYRHRDNLGLDEKVKAGLVDMLSRYCGRATLEEKRRFHERYLRGEDLLTMDRQSLSPLVYDALSPAGKLAGLECSVGLVHDPEDRVVPASEARQLFRELQTLPERERHRLLVTPLMSHVTLSDALHLVDVPPLLRVLAPLVAS